MNILDDLKIQLDNLKDSDGFKQNIESSKEYVPSNKIRDLIKDKRIVPQIKNVRDRKKYVEDVLLGELSKREKELLKFDDPTNESVISDLNDVMMAKEDAVRNIETWCKIQSALNKTRTVLLTGDFKSNPNILTSIQNANFLHNTLPLFLEACNKDLEITAMLEGLTTEESIAEFANQIIEKCSFFKSDEEKKSLFNQVNSITTIINKVVSLVEEDLDKPENTLSEEQRSILKEKIYNIKEISTENKDNTAEYLNNIHELLVSFFMLVSLIKDTKIEEEYVYKVAYDILTSLDLIEDTTLVQLMHQLLPFKEEELRRMYSNMEEETDKSKNLRLKAALDKNLFFKYAMSFYTISTGNKPENTEDIKFLRQILLTLYFYVSLVPNEQVKAIHNFTVKF